MIVLRKADLVSTVINIRNTEPSVSGPSRVTIALSALQLNTPSGRYDPGIPSAAQTSIRSCVSVSLCQGSGLSLILLCFFLARFLLPAALRLPDFRVSPWPLASSTSYKTQRLWSKFSSRGLSHYGFLTVEFLLVLRYVCYRSRLLGCYPSHLRWTSQSQDY
jgi:hypothetical protein